MIRDATIALIALSFAACPTVGQETPQIGLWQRHEIKVLNDATYQSPIRDVDLNVDYTRPDGTSVRFFGFYDGDQTWRARFMPDQLGVWRYEATFSDGRPATSGSFRCVESDIPGPVCALPENPIWFGRRNGSRFLMRSFHCGDRFFAENWDDPGTDEDDNPRTLFLDWAQAQGYNTLSIASHYLNRSIQGRGEGWQTPKLWPLDPQEYRKAEAIFDDLADRGIVVFPFAGFFGRNSNFPADKQEQQQYLRYTIARFGAYWNLLWNVGGPEPLLRGKPFMDYGEVDRAARLIEEFDVFGHLITVHNATGDDVFRGEPWHGFGTLQGPKTLDRRKLAAGLSRNHHPSRPLYAQETLWPGNVMGHPRYSDQDIERNAMTALFCAAMINYGDMDGNSSSGFSASLHLEDAVESRHRIIHRVWQTFSTLPFEQCKPRPDLVSNGYCLADSGKLYHVYLPDSSQTRVRAIPGPYQAKWIKVGSSSAPVETGAIDVGGDLKTPDGQSNWILVLQSMQRPTTGKSGVISIEAEAGRGEWLIVDARRGKAIRDPGGGRMRYDVHFDSPGKYYVYLLAKQGPRGKDKENDVLLSLDGQRLFGVDGVTRPDGMRSYGDWKWTRLPKGPGWHTPNPIRDGGVYFYIDAAGTRTLEIGHRSKNFMIDRIVLKRNDPSPPPEVD